MPAIQGLLRGSAESGSYLFTRNLIPWQDPRWFDTRTEERMFTIYKLITSESSYWNRTAKQLRAKGTACCYACATPMGSDYGTCCQCLRELHGAGCPSWLTNFIRGRSPFSGGSEDSDGDNYDLESDSSLDYERRQDRWKESLAGYPRLDEDFQNLGELFCQYKKFLEWTSEKRAARWEIFGTKRKRQVVDGEAKEERQSHAGSEVSK